MLNENLKFRPAGDIRDFHELLNKIKKNDQKFLLWQNQKNNDRIKFDVKLKSFIFNKSNISITIHIEAKDFSLIDKNKPLFLYEEEKGVLFKGSYETWVSGLLKFTPDTNVLIRENRKSFRTPFQYLKVGTSLKGLDNRVIGEFRLKDICSCGFSIFMKKEKISEFNKDCGYLVSEIAGINTSFLPKAKIKHISPVRKNKNANLQYSVGFQFEEESFMLQKIIEQFQNQKGAW